MIIKKVGILYHPKLAAAQTKAQELTQFLISRNIETWSASAWETNRAVAMLDGTDLILTTGGDGTILRAAQVTSHCATPIAGINMGILGFLTEIKIADAESALSQLLDGRGWLDERAMLEARLVNPEGQTSAPGVFYALNDVVIARGAIVRLIKINTSIDGQPLTDYRSDGVIVATATGSTGYALAAGGPVLYPQSHDILVVPILSHLGLNYPLVLPPESVIKMQLVTNIPATLSIDGYENIPLTDGSVVTVKLSSRKVRFLRLSSQNNFFSLLQGKLKGNN